MPLVNHITSRISPQMIGESRSILRQHFGMLEPLRLFWSQFLEVRDSPVHGRGVFATRALPPETVLTTYPCHLVTEGLECSTVGDFTVDPTLLAKLIDDYSVDMNGTGLITGLPTKCDVKALLGHMINDASLEDFFGNTPIEKLRDPEVLCRIICRHYTNTLGNMNCTIAIDRSNLVALVVSKREIATNEELLVNYGIQWWMEHAYGANALTRYPFIDENMKLLDRTNQQFHNLLDRLSNDLH
jgi:hypothetical protein